MRERERGEGREGEGESKKERERKREGEGGGDVTFWYPSMTKAVLIKLRRKKISWVFKACLPDMDKSDGG
jgi:hypothetical protein